VEQGPLWGCDRVGVHKNAIVPMRLHPAPGSDPRKRAHRRAEEGPRNLFRGSDPKEARGASIDALTASFTVASPKGPLLHVALAPAPPYAGAPGCGSRLA
jgi:hypothetical protein